jgi:tetratricopeptide (TPR) repeat protein
MRINKIKNKIGVVEAVSYSTESINIFSHIALGHTLSTHQYQWLIKNKILSICSILLGQLSELQRKFQINEIELDPQHQLILCLILKKLDEDIVLDTEEQSFLKANGLEYALAVAQKAEFLQLKKKYQTSEITDEEPTSHLFKVLKKISNGIPLPDPDINYLKKRKLYSTLKISFKLEADLLIEKIKQGLGLTANDIERCTRYGYPEIIFLSLKHEFQIDSMHPMDSSLFGILDKLQSNRRLSDDDLVWLNAEKLFYSRSKIFTTHHRIEATHCEDEFKLTKGYWNLVNASAHWRKANEPKLAVKLTNNLVVIRSIKEAKLKAALFTTRGGALRDLDMLADAENCALEAIKIFPNSHNPYTLMGALCYDCGNYDEGDKWFEKAIKRGAKPNDQDAEIRSILNKKSEKERASIIAHLLAKDPIQFSWVKQFKPKPKKPSL